MTPLHQQKWYKELDISSQGKPMGIQQIDHMPPTGHCYCIVKQNGTINQVDVYENGQKTHYKKFKYDNLGRVIENAMYTPDSKGDWQIIDDVWYYEYDQKTGYRNKKVMRMPGASTAREILYNEQGNRISESTTVNMQYPNNDLWSVRQIEFLQDALKGYENKHADYYPKKEILLEIPGIATYAYTGVLHFPQQDRTIIFEQGEAFGMKQAEIMTYLKEKNIEVSTHYGL